MHHNAVNASLVILFFSISFNVGMAHSSAIQRYRELHTQKTGITNKTTKPTLTRWNILDDTGAAITEKASTISSTINVSDVIGKGSKEIRTTTSPSPFWSSSLYSSDNYSIGISSPTIADRNSIGGSTDSNDSTPTNSTATSHSTLETLSPTFSTKTSLVRTTTVIPSLNYTKISPSSRIDCTATCGSCTETRPLSGVLKSPNYPKHYYLPSTDIGYMYCYYSINVPAGKRIHLVFQEFNLAFTEWGDFLEVVDKSPKNYGKVLATFNAGDEAVATTTSGESMLVYFEGNPGGFTKNRKAPAWRATYYVVGHRVEILNSSARATSNSHKSFYVPVLLFSIVLFHTVFTTALYCINIPF